MSDREIEHEVTSSRKARTPQNPLAVVNEADGLLRHSSSNHKRETIAASKRRQGALYRAFAWLVWKNYVKPVNMALKTATPAMLLGILERPLKLSRLLAKRLFVERVGLKPVQREWYERRIKTRPLPVNRVHELHYAY